MLQSFSFNGARQIDAKASFFRYDSGSSGGGDESLRVRADGNDLGLYLPGDAITLPAPATRWEIVPVIAACAGTVRLGMGSIASARLSGTVRVIDEITDAITFEIVTLPTAIVAITWQAIVEPTENVRGLILRGWSGTVQPGAGGSVNMQLAAAKSMPVGFNLPAQKFNIATAYSTSGALSFFENQRNKLLPAGFGVYVGREILTAAAVSATATLNYELL